MVKQLFMFLLWPLAYVAPACAQQANISIAECFALARNNNLLIKQAGKSLQARQYSLQAERQSYLPKADLLAGYNYLSKPLEVNLQTVKDGILEGTSRQNVNTANEVFREITGSELSPTTQDLIYNASKNTLNTFYPNYNPPLSKRQYFTASVGVRQPIYLGNKLKTVQDAAAAAVHEGVVNISLTQQQVDLAVALQYIRILYLNSILSAQQRMVSSLQSIATDAAEMVTAQVLPPYQRNWAKIAVIQARTRLQNQELEKQNALIELNKVLGIPLDSALTITDTLQFETAPLPSADVDFWRQNPVYHFADSKTALAKTVLQGSRAFSLPNIFAIGNINLYQRDLPVITPPWLLGIEMQWNIFNGTQTHKRVQASRQLLAETELATAQTRSLLETQLKVSMNRITALQNDVAALDSAHVMAGTTTSMVAERMHNRLATPKDVNEALLIEEELAKAYYTAVMGYYLALAEYCSLTGDTRQIAKYIQ
jgi:outer membrane protein TolC